MSWKASLILAAVSVGCASASYTMLIPFLPMYLLAIGASEEAVALWSGAVFSVSFLIGAIMAPIWGKLADKKGKRLMAIRAGACLSIVYLLGAFVTSPQELFVVRLLQGFANGFVPACMAVVSSTVPKEKLGFSIGIMQTGQIIGTVLGPLAGGLLAQVFGMRVSFIVAGVILLLITGVVTLFIKEPPLASVVVDDGSLLDDFRYAVSNKMLVEMLLLVAVIQIAAMSLQPVVALYVAELLGGMDGVMLGAGFIFSLGGIAGAFSTGFWGGYAQRSGYFKAIVIAFGGAGIFNFLQFFPTDIYWFAGLQFMFGLFFFGASPAVNANMINCTDAKFRGRVFGMATTAHQTGSMLGPLLGSFISTYVGIKYIFPTVGTALILISLYLFFRFVRQPSGTAGAVH